MKKALSAVLAVVLVLGVCFSVPMIASANDTDPFTYELDNAENPTGYIITGVKNGVEGTVEIPATYQPAEDVVLFPTDPEQQDAPDGSYDITTVAVDGEDATIEDATITLTVEESSVTYAEPNAVVKVTAEKEGYEVVSITVTETESATAVEFDTVEGTFTMPEAAVTVTVVFEEEIVTYEVTFSSNDVTKGTITAKVDGEAIATGDEVVAGKNVVFTLETIGDNELTAFTVNGEDMLAEVSEGVYTEENVAEAVTVVATFTAKAAPKFAITDCTVDGKGSATATVDEAAAGDPVTVEVTEEEGYALKTLKYKYNDGEEKSADITKGDDGYSFTMPAYPVTIEATFVEVFAITGVNTATGKVTANVTEAEAGATITLTVDPEDGYQLVAGSLKVNNGDVALAAGNSFIMPNAPVTVTAVFEAIEYEASVATGIINGKVEATAKRGETTPALTALNVGDTVTLTVTIDKGCELKADSLKVSYTDGEGTKYVELDEVTENEEYTFSMPAADVTISAQIIPSSLPVIGIKAGALNGATGVTAYTVHADQTRFVAKDGVLFEKVTTTTPAATEGGEATTTTTLKLIAFPANYTVAENAAKTYTIPAKVPEETGLAVTEVADGAFQALGNVQYVFCEGNVTITELNQPAFYTTSEGEDGATVKTSNKKFHTTTGHTEGALKVKEGEEATCQSQGTKIKECTYCGEVVHTEKYSDANAHKFIENDDDGFVVEIQATCQEKGLKIKACQNDRCNYSVSEYYTVGHTYATEFTVDTKATCEDGDVNTVNTGSKSRHCTTPGCKATTDVTTISALTHTITDNKGNENIIAKKDATCKDAGFVKGNCDHCGNVVTINYEKLTHKYVDVVDAEVTCTVNGWQHKECEYCGDYKDGSDMELTAKGHIAASVKDENDNFVTYKWTVVKAPTCSEAGFAEVRCENCGIQMVDPEGEIEYTRVLPATGKHDYKDYTETKAATCEDDGEKTGTCACGATDVQKIVAPGHKWAKEYTVDTPATCTKKGLESKKCTVCGDKDEETARQTALAPHTADASWTTVTGKEATCYAEGEKTGTCAVCNATNCVLPIEKLEHRWATEAVNLKADIVGTIQDTETDGTPKVDATTGEPVMVPYTYKAPTCEVEGYKAIYCTNKGCPTSIVKEGSLVKVDALGHDYDEAYNIDIPANKPATCKEAGYMFKWCKTCSEANKANENKGYVKIELAQKAHEYEAAAEILRAPITIQVAKEVDGKIELGKDGKPVMVGKQVSAPDCENPGYTAVYCKNYETCGELKDVTEVAALGHLYDATKWTKVSDATCMAKEIQSNTCLRPNCANKEQTREYGELANHNYSTTKTTVYPTCEKDGVEYYACTTTLNGKQCESRSQEKAIDALGHKFAEGAKFNVITEVGCEVNGEKVMECLNSFHKVTKEPYTETTNSGTTGDSNASGNGGTTPAPAAEGNGTEGGTTTTTRPAAPDGYEYCAGYTVITPATGHAFSDEYTEDIAATCEKEGSESRHCTNEGCKVTTGSRKIAKLGHNYSTEYKTVEGKAATCQAEGQEARYCLNKDCKSYTGERRLAKIDHTYNDRTWKTVEGKAPTCEGKGLEYNNCTVCNEYTEREAKALGHKWAETWTIADADCVKKGQSYKACERAGCTAKSELEETPALGHKLRSTDNGYTKVDQTATNKCTVTGYEEGYCYVCNENNKNNLGKIRINVVESVGHKFDTEPTSVIAATCEGTGTITGKCAICNQDNVSNTIPALGHTWGDWEMRKDDSGDQLFDSCKTEDSMVRYCTVKNCNGYEYGENTAHTESGWILDSDATCSTNGKMHTECTVCKFEMNKQTFYATNAHEYEEDLEKRVEPTCNTKGSKTLICNNCKDKKVEEIAVNGHTFTDWKVFVEPTCTEKGIRQSVCTVCLTTKSEKILANGHTESDWITTAPTCTQTGEKHKECTVCKEVIKTETIAALGHNYTTSNTCSAEGCEAQLYEYKLIGESKTDIEIVKYNPDAKNVVENVVIPSEIDGYVVKAIGDRAFMKIVDVPGAIINEETGERAQTTTKCEKSQFTTVTIPETVTTIGDYAFATASDNFKSVVIPGTVTTIGDYAFGYNVELNWIDDPEAEDDEVAIKVESTPIIESRVADFAIYGVKDSAAAVYAAQNPENDADDFKFAAIADIYEVAIPEEFTEVAEKADDKVVIFKEFVAYEDNDPKKKDIVEQIKTVVDINVSGYSVEVVSSQSYDVIEKDEQGNETVKETLRFYGTGTKVLVKEGSNVVDVIEIVVQGDVNGDGAVDAIDCMLVQLASQNQKALDGVYLTAGDYNYDGKVEVADFSGVVNRVFGTDVIIGEEETTTPSTSAPTTTEPTTQAPASTEPSTEGTSESTTQAPAESTPAESTPAESTPAESTPVESTPAESTPAESTPAQAS